MPRIANIPRIAMFINGESYLTNYIASLYAAMHGLGKPRSYAELLTLSGAGNRLCWLPGTWNGGNIDILNMEEPPFAPHHRVLKALGMEADIRFCQLECEDYIHTDEATARKEIIASIDAGIPVIAMGIFGPPECCIVFGYEDGGDFLIGWNYFQEDEGFSMEEPFRKSNWYKGLSAYLLLKGGNTCPAERDNAMEAFTAIVHHARQREIRGMKVGLSAWEAMLDQLERADFTDIPTLFDAPSDEAWNGTSQGRFYVYCDSLCQIHERGIVCRYLQELADRYTEWREFLLPAIQAWQECAQYGGFLWKHLSHDETGYERFKNPEIRKILAEEGRRSMKLDEEAVSWIERLLAFENVHCAR